MSGCKSVSTVPSVKPTIPEVRCQQADSPDIAPAPRPDEWIDYTPPMPGHAQGSARLSERAVLWIVDVLGVVRKQRGLREIEHACLDDAEAKGLIRQ